MKRIDTELIGKILIIIGLLTALTIFAYGAFLAHPLLGIFAVGIILIFFGRFLE